MAKALRNYLIQFSVQNEQIISKLDQTTQALRKFESRTSYYLRNVNRQFATLKNVAVSIGALSVVSRLGGAIRSAIDPALSRIDTIERFGSSLQAITGSSKTAEKALAVLKETVTDTPFRLDTAAEAAQNFALRGVDLSRSIAYVKAAADAAAFYGDGTDDTLATITDAMAQMITQGKVTMDQLGRLYTRGIPAVDLYAKATGRSASEVQKALQKGEITAQQFFDTLAIGWRDGIGGLQKIEGAAKSAANSWEATFGNFRSRIAIAMAELIQTIDASLRNNGLPAMRESILIIASHIQSFIRTVAQYADPVISTVAKLARAIKELTEVLRPVIPLIQISIATWLSLVFVPAIYSAITVRVSRLNAAIIELNKTAIRNVRSMTESALATYHAARGMTVITDATGKFRKGIMTTSVILDRSVTTAASRFSGVLRVLPIIARSSFRVIGVAASIFSIEWLAAGRSFSMAWHAMASHAYTAASSILSVVARLLDAVSVIVPFTKGAANSVQSWADSAKAAADRHRAAIDGVKNGFGDFKKMEEDAKKATDSAFESIQDGAENATEAADKAAKAAKGQLASFDELHTISSDNGVDEGKNALADITVPEFNMPDLGAALNDASSSVNSFSEALKNAFQIDTSSIEKAINWVTELIAKLEALKRLNFFKIIVEILARLGDFVEDIIEFLKKNKIVKFFIEVFARLGDFVKDIIEWAKNTKVGKFIAEAAARLGKWVENIIEWAKNTKVGKFIAEAAARLGKWVENIIEWAKNTKVGKFIAEAAARLGDWVEDILRWAKNTKIGKFIAETTARLGEWVENILKAVKSGKALEIPTILKTTIPEAISKFFEWLKNNKVVEITVKLFEALEKVPVLGWLFKIVKGGAKAIPIIGEILIFIDVIKAFAENIEFLKQQFDEIKKSADMLGEGIRKIFSGDILGGLSDTLLGIAGIVNGVLISIIKLVWDAFDNIFMGLPVFLVQKFGELSIWILEKIRDFFVTLGENAVSIWNGIGETLSNAWNGLGEISASIWNGIVETLANIWNGMKEIAATVWSGVKDAIVNTWNGIGEVLSNVWNGIKEVLSNVWNGIKEVAATVWNGIKDAIVNTWNGIGEVLSNVWNGIKEVLSNVWNGIKEVAATVWNGVKDAIVNTWNGIKEVASTVWSGIGETLSNVWNGIKEKATEVWDGIVTFLTETWDGITTQIQEVWDGIVTFFTEAWDGITTQIQEVWDGIVTFLTETWDSIIAKLTEIIENVKTFLGDTLENIKTKISEAWENIKTSLSQTWDTIKGSAQEKWNAIKENISSITENTKTNMKNAWDNIKSTLLSTWDSISGGASQKWEAIKGVVRGSANGIVGMVNRFIGFLNSIVIRVPTINIPFVGTVGGWSVSLPNIPSIPLLASGGIVERPTMAIVGEAGAEAVVPLTRNNVLTDGIRDAVYEAVVMAISSSIVRGTSETERNIVIEINGRELARAVIDDMSDLSRRLGVRFS